MPFRIPPAVLFRLLPFACFIAVLALRGFTDLQDAHGAGWDRRWLYGLQVVVPAALLILWRKHFVELAALPKPDHWYPISVLVGLAVFSIWIAPMPPWMHLGEPGTRFVPIDSSQNLQWDLIALRCTGAVLLVPVMEELFWRSFLMRWIDQRDFLLRNPAEATRKSWILSSFVFGLAHEQWMAGLLAGMAFAALYRRTGNLWFAVLAHATANLALAIWVIAARDWIYW